MSNDEQFSDHDYDSRAELNFWCSEDTLSHTVHCSMAETFIGQGPQDVGTDIFLK